MLETGKEGWVGKLVQVRVGPENLIRKRAVFEITQIIRLADDENGRFVDILPQAGSGSPVGGLGGAQRLDQ